MKPRKRDQRRKQRDEFERAYSEQYPVTVLTTADLFERAPTGDYTRTPTQVGWPHQSDPVEHPALTVGLGQIRSDLTEVHGDTSDTG